tara:strand:+ start:820 stop:1131 length:312 start_codon:yes stop_codon:yes gene_type:complete
MKIDLTTKILDTKGEPVKTEDASVVMLGLLIEQAVLNPEESDKAERKSKDFALWYDKIKDKTEADLTSEDITHIKKRVYGIYPTLWAGQVDMILEGKTFKLKK